MIIRQFLIFAGVGAVGTAVQYVALIAFAKVGINPVVGSTVGFVAGAIVNYLLNYRLTFRSTMAHRRTAPRFATIAASALLLNTVLMWLLIYGFTMHYLLAQTVVTGVVLIWNYVFSRLWTFNDASRVTS
jgi:putative flippase GtrA